MSVLTQLDEIREELEKRFPGWQVWYVRNLNGSTTWCARPWPLINASSPEQLIADVIQAHTEAAAEWPALAGFGDYATHAPAIKQVGSF